MGAFLAIEMYVARNSVKFIEPETLIVTVLVLFFAISVAGSVLSCGC